VPATPKAILALDVGDRRVGLAVASLATRLPRPLQTLVRDDSFFEALRDIIKTENVEVLVVGFPRGMAGQPTAQTEAVEAFADELRRHCGMPVHFQDESVTSKQAEAELEARRKAYQRGDIDALAATYILEDFLAGHKELAA
jgi:putative holliday junction resolvase